MLSSKGRKSSASKTVFSYENQSISCLVCSHFESSRDLVFIGTKSQIIAEKIILTLDGSGIEKKIQTLTWPLGSPCLQLAISPQTRSRPDLDNLVIAIACQDYSIIYLDNFKRMELSGGEGERKMATDFTNDLCFDPSGEHLAAVGDDNHLRIWNLPSSNEPILKVRLPDRGLSVQYHQRQSSLVLVGCANGAIRLIDSQDGSISLSIFVPHPLSYVKWHPENPSLLGAVAGSSFFIYNLESSSFLIPEHTGDGLSSSNYFEWNPLLNSKQFCISSSAPVQDNLRSPAVLIYPNSFTKVPHTFLLPNRHKVSGVSFSAQLPVLFVASGSNIYIVDGSK